MSDQQQQQQQQNDDDIDMVMPLPETSMEVIKQQSNDSLTRSSSTRIPVVTHCKTKGKTTTSTLQQHASSSVNSSSVLPDDEHDVEDINNNNHNDTYYRTIEHQQQQQHDNNTQHSKSSKRNLPLMQELLDVGAELVHFIRYRNWKKKCLTILLIITFVFVLFDVVWGSGHIQRLIDEVVRWMQHDNTHTLWGVLAFILLFVVTTLLFIPPFVLTFMCGYVFTDVFCEGNIVLGGVTAVTACFLGSVIGALLAFCRARYMTRDLVQLFSKRYVLVRAVDRAIDRNGFRVMLMLRLCPLIPFNALNYIGGITAIRWETFVLTLAGILPLQILTVVMGATADFLVTHSSSTAATTNSSTATAGDYPVLVAVLLGAGLASAVIAIVITYRFAKKELRKELQMEEEMEQHNSKKKNLLVGALDGNDTLEPLGLEMSYQKGVDDEEWFWLFP